MTKTAFIDFSVSHSVNSDSVTTWTVARQASLSMGFFRQYWSKLPFPSPGDLLKPGIKPRSLTLQAESLPAELQVNMEQQTGSK